ncbi:holo-ACP synthase [Marinobacterium sp. AK62]|uniref:Holo-[acyl-carrier-protein] synthase n=1 Tax=Marinobacterium alkalitolerans TaxID=1542925 RepID=A0ABS3Z9K3_9GAMM|nr:holo-ACP synthase [Marinobacterium alkalitolerans]MBP0048383.1 holo-ACP synthase [Marinobacterium alkalitolerans]
MIIGIGTDLLEIARVEAALTRTPRLSERILTPKEWQAFATATQPARFLAKRFAAKEAAAKALGTGIGRGVSWQHMEVGHDDSGRPLMTLSGGALEVATALGVQQLHLSYSDEREYVSAFVIAEQR